MTRAQMLQIELEQSRALFNDACLAEQRTQPGTEQRRLAVMDSISAQRRMRMARLELSALERDHRPAA
jgi:hypothetical protein